MKKYQVSHVVASLSLCLLSVAPATQADTRPTRHIVPKVERMSDQLTTLNFNHLVLRAIQKMPTGGGYSTNRTSILNLGKAVTYSPKGELLIHAKQAVPSYCSGATYLAFLHALKEAEQKGYLHVTPMTAKSFHVSEQKDGVGVWGRWNANGPGTASLFYETKLGRSFESYADARPGDFMKIFWTDKIGRKEFGHSVIFLGTYQKKAVTMVKFWSSNQPGGYGEKSVPISKIKWAIFSRVTNLERVNHFHRIKPKDVYLASMLTQSYTRAEVRKKAGIK